MAEYKLKNRPFSSTSTDNYTKAKEWANELKSVLESLGLVVDKVESANSSTYLPTSDRVAYADGETSVSAWVALRFTFLGVTVRIRLSSSFINTGLEKDGYITSYQSTTHPYTGNLFFQVLYSTSFLTIKYQSTRAVVTISEIDCFTAGDSGIYIHGDTNSAGGFTGITGGLDQGFNGGLVAFPPNTGAYFNAYTGQYEKFDLLVAVTNKGIKGKLKGVYSLSAGMDSGVTSGNKIPVDGVDYSLIERPIYNSPFFLVK